MIKYRIEPNGEATNLQFCAEDYVAQGTEVLIEGDRLPSRSTLHSKKYRDAEPMRLLRIDRDKLLASSDWIGLSDTALTNEQAAKWKLYRQKLRDLPKGLTTEFKVKNVKWPTKP